MALRQSVYQSSTADERPSSQTGRWKPSISTTLCAFCNKTVYPAEEIMGAGQRFHKLCLKCTSCKSILNPGSLNEREKKIYCVPCYRRHFAPRAVGHGLATSYVDTPPSNLESNDDEETDYQSYHQKPLTRSSNDDDYRETKSMSYVTTRSTPVSTSNRPTSVNVSNGNAFKMSSGGGIICSRCSKTVYSAEEVKAAGKSYHKRCYNCAHCKGSISGGRYSVHEEEIYDNNCYQRLFGPRGVGFGVGAGTLSTGN